MNKRICVTILIILLAVCVGCSSERVIEGAKPQYVSIERSFPVSERTLFRTVRDALRDLATELKEAGDEDLTISTRDTGDPARIVAHWQTSRELLRKQRMTFEFTIVGMADLGSAMSIRAYPEVYEITPLAPSGWVLSSRSVNPDSVEEMMKRIETRSNSNTRE
ncbi:hypothetical protein ACFL1X_00175 [Candidatus Hydrogenedentota bacterium]